MRFDKNKDGLLSLGEFLIMMEEEGGDSDDELIQFFRQVPNPLFFGTRSALSPTSSPRTSCSHLRPSTHPPHPPASSPQHRLPFPSLRPPACPVPAIQPQHTPLIRH
eukprot:3366925-Rhodomonas_salina.3